MRVSRTLALLALIALPATAAAKKGGNDVPATAAQAGPVITPPKNVFLRNSFDVDPSSYIGRFIPDGTAPDALDETTAMPMPCSGYIKYESVGGGNVSYDEVFAASTDASARVGVPPILSGKGEAHQTATVRVKYKLTTKMRAKIEDPAGFAACCAQGPDQCTSQYISEFLSGIGSVWFVSTTSGKASVSGAGSAVAGDIEANRGVNWQKSITFEEPVYFAFKTTPNKQATDVCGGDWVHTPPLSPDGKYFVGVSNPLETEQLARDAAIGDARKSVVNYIGERIKSGQISTSVTSGGASDLSTELKSTNTLERAASGVASFVKDRCWAVEPQQRADGTWQIAHVLAFLPKTEEEKAASAVVTATKKP